MTKAVDMMDLTSIFVARLATTGLNFNTPATLLLQNPPPDRQVLAGTNRVRPRPTSPKSDVFGCWRAQLADVVEDLVGGALTLLDHPLHRPSQAELILSCEGLRGDDHDLDVPELVT